MAALADGLGVGRLLLAAVFPWALARGGWLALVLFGLAAASDYVDGPIARRAGRVSSYGGTLDNVADVAFVLTATVTGAARGALSWVVPASIVLSAGSYALASLGLSRATGTPRLARSRVGHAAGVCNYVCAGLVAGVAALPGPTTAAALTVAGAVTIVLNGAALLARLRS